MPEFLIIRHGQSLADLENRYEGRVVFANSQVHLLEKSSHVELSNP